MVAGAVIRVNICPAIHIFGARETTLPQGFGTTKVLIDLIQRVFPGATAEEIIYPAAGGTNAEYAASVTQGVAAVRNQLDDFQSQCPNSIVIMHGYSQGAQIMDDAFCGGPDGTSLNSTVPLVSRVAARNVAAIILMGDPRHVGGLPYNAGNATGPGFAARPVGFQCPAFQDRMQLYCDSPDPFCSNGTNNAVGSAVHEGYGKEYGHDALRFILGKVIA
ncbi:Acetylxylan esterase At 0.90 angstrom resolution [Thozetella sp. PMI_491]|nr:Acetylxylan esterase At 0.90 angstrom resolution [Thozetella sp. PMI_491]